MMKQKLTEKGKLNRLKYCIDCEYSETHQTGSTLWVSCSFQKGWRSINSTCNLPAKTVEDPEIQGLYPIGNCCQSFWTLKVLIELAKFRDDQKKEVKSHNGKTGTDCRRENPKTSR